MRLCCITKKCCSYSIFHTQSCSYRVHPFLLCPRHHISPIVLFEVFRDLAHDHDKFVVLDFVPSLFFVGGVRASLRGLRRLCVVLGLGLGLGFRGCGVYVCDVASRMLCDPVHVMRRYVLCHSQWN